MGKSERPSNVCPNCWGHQDYDNEKVQPLENHQRTAEEKGSGQSFINKFTTTYIDGVVKTDKADVHFCETCKRQFTLTIAE